jgi:hypothetical protein
MVVLTSHADQTTTDNLLTNKDFDAGLEGWTVEDPNLISLDGSCYSESGLCQSVRWSGDLGKTISQTITNLESDYVVKDVYLSFTALGCNNEATGAWCSQGTDYDKVQAVIQLSNGTSQENLYLQQELDYNDGTQDYSLSTETLDTWLTNNLTIDFSMTGIDTGDWDGQFGPIVDNINLQLGLEEHVPVVIEPIVEIKPEVIEPIVEIKPEVIEPIVEIEPEVIKGLSLEAEVINDIILDPVAMNIPEIPQVPELSMNIEVPVDMPEIEAVEEIQVNDPIEEIAEVEIEEQPEELKEPNVEQDLADAEEKLNEPDNSQKENTSEKKKDSNTKETTTEKGEEKPQSKTVAKVNKPVADSKEPSIDADPLGKVNIASMVYLQMIPETITIQETVSLTQEMIYEQDIGAFTSSATYDSLISSANSRWLRMVDVRPKHTFSSYGR